MIPPAPGSDAALKGSWLWMPEEQSSLSLSAAKPAQVEDAAFQDLVRRLHAGDAAAAAELVRKQEGPLRRVIRSQLRSMGLSSQDSETAILQTVLASFLVRAALGQLELSRPADVLTALVPLVRKKLANLDGQATVEPTSPPLRRRKQCRYHHNRWHSVTQGNSNVGVCQG